MRTFALFCVIVCSRVTHFVNSTFTLKETRKLTYLLRNANFDFAMTERNISDVWLPQMAYRILKYKLPLLGDKLNFVNVWYYTFREKVSWPDPAFRPMHHNKVIYYDT